ncbi:cellulose binding domain-containing protein [Tundrisphaera sp. TA3]|uniref:cellulose binding domain-containing protein n=1 Tax=Tundrisphaera sp. TA3 TaxID=3435775 RepID=UPI003EBADA79
MEARIVQAGGLAASYALASDWGSGFQGAFRIDNSQAEAAPGWRLEFDLSTPITSIWNATVLSRVGNHYVVGGASWNATMATGSSIEVGFVATGQSATPANIKVGASTPPTALPSVSVADARVAEGNTGKTILPFVVSLSRPGTAPISVDYATAGGTATPGADFIAKSGTLTFAPGETSKTVGVEIIGDAAVEGDETLSLVLSSPSGATLGTGRGTGTIVDDDTPAPPAGNVSISYATTNDWGSGLNGEVTLKNGTAKAQSGWTLAFDFPGSITSIWDAQVVAHVGTRYTVTGANWNGSIAAGGTASFGFTANPGGSSLKATNFVFRATEIDGGPANRAPVGVGDSAIATQDTPITIRVLANDTDPDGDALSVASFTAPAHGTVAANPDGTLTYTPTPSYLGADSFTYVVSDGKGGTATATVAVAVVAPTPAGIWPDRVYAPYVDMGLHPTYDLAAASRATGVKFFTLAFITADPAGHPSWGGFASYGVDGGEFDRGVRSQIGAVRALGGDVMVSFGGASGSELAQSITDVGRLTAAYQKVVDAYGLTRLDFDIEGAAVADRASIDRRSRAIAALQRNAAAAGRTLHVEFTLPVLPTGLTADGLNVVRSAINAGVQVGGVNGMAMDYGDSAAPNPSGRMGDYAIQVAHSLHDQLLGLYGNSRTDAQLWKMVGITPMIGLNDITTEVFDQQEAREVAEFARQKGIGRLSIWSLNRDRQSPSGRLNYVDLNSSSLVQSPYEFSNIFKGFQS